MLIGAIKKVALGKNQKKKKIRASTVGIEIYSYL